jgi:hypothetical protein
MDTKNLEARIDNLRHSVEILILIEFCRLNAKREQVREIMGSLDNNLFAKVNLIVNSNKKSNGKKK